MSALTVSQRTELKSAVDGLKAQGYRDTSDILTKLVTPPQTGTTNITVTVDRPARLVALEQAYVAAVAAANIPAGSKIEVIIATMKARYEAAASADEKAIHLKTSNELTALALVILREGGDISNITGQATTSFTRTEPVYGPPMIAFPITADDVEDVQRNP